MINNKFKKLFESIGIVAVWLIVLVFINVIINLFFRGTDVTGVIALFVILIIVMVYSVYKEID